MCLDRLWAELDHLWICSRLEEEQFRMEWVALLKGRDSHVGLLFRLVLKRPYDEVQTGAKKLSFMIIWSIKISIRMNWWILCKWIESSLECERTVKIECARRSHRSVWAWECPRATCAEGRLLSPSWISWLGRSRLGTLRRRISWILLRYFQDIISNIILHTDCLIGFGFEYSHNQ